jgi:hypothetical protein
MARLPYFKTEEAPVSRAALAELAAGACELSAVVGQQLARLGNGDPAQLEEAIAGAWAACCYALEVRDLNRDRIMQRAEARIAEMRARGA